MPILHVIETYRYTGLFVLLALEYLILIVPGETELTTTGVLMKDPAYHLHLWPVILATSLGTFTGAMLAYGIGRLLGRPFLLRYGKYVWLTPERLAQSEHLFLRYTILTLALSRYIAFVRDIVPYVAGMNRTPLRVFIPVILISSFVWTASFVLAGGLIVSVWETIRTHWTTVGPWAVAGVVLVLLIIWLVKRWLHKWASGAAASTAPEGDR